MSQQLIIDALPQLIANMIRLANGGYRRVERKYVVSDAPPDRSPDSHGVDLPAPAMVLVEKRVTTADADRTANIYLIDRILGRPRQQLEFSGAKEMLTAAQKFVIPPVDDRPEPEPQG